MIRKFLATALAICGTVNVMAQDAKPEAQQPKEKEWKFALGAGVFTAESPYQGVGSESFAVPMVSAKYGDFFAGPGVTRYSLFSVGYKVLKTDKMSLSLLVNPFSGFTLESDDLDPGYRGIDDRDPQVEAGVDLVYKPDFWGLRLNVYGVWGERGGHWGGAIGKRWQLDEKWSVYGRVLATMFSHDYIDYYFQVSAADAARNPGLRSSYGADAESSFGADVTVTYKINDKWSTSCFLGFEQLSNGIKDSPLVEDDSLFRGGLSVLYNF